MEGAQEGRRADAVPGRDQAFRLLGPRGEMDAPTIFITLCAGKCPRAAAESGPSARQVEELRLLPVKGEWELGPQN